eukprot:c10869_g1_i1.p1 GENE.c10869_g1_i1~~c10869_g1_i1.p1  ORF type:complete len:375 (+),score=89.67 c10869_g1_i1:41-1165(+)
MDQVFDPSKCPAILDELARGTTKRQKEKCFTQLRQVVFGTDNIQMIIAQIEEVKTAIQDTGVCGKTWGLNTTAYKCITCGADESCVVCVDCFFNGDHDNHDYRMIRTTAGCCDCGDAQSWDPRGFCRYHQGPKPDPLLLPLIPPLLLERGCAVFHHVFLRVLAATQASEASELVKWVCDEVIDQWGLRVLVSHTLCRSEGTQRNLLVQLLERENTDPFITVVIEPLLYKLIVSLDFKLELVRGCVVQIPHVVNNNSSLLTFGVQILTMPDFAAEIGRPDGYLQALVAQSCQVIERSATQLLCGPQGVGDTAGTINRRILNIEPNSELPVHKLWVLTQYVLESKPLCAAIFVGTCKLNAHLYLIAFVVVLVICLY